MTLSFPSSLFVWLCVTGGHRKEMPLADWWVRVIYVEPGLRDASPHYIILYPSVMQIVNSHHFMMNYFPDLHFNDSRPSIQALVFTPTRPHSHRCADDSFVQNCVKSWSQRERRRKRSEGKWLLLEEITLREWVRSQIGILTISQSNLVACKWVTKRWKGDDGERTLKEGARTSNMIRCGRMFHYFLYSFIW